MPHCDNAELVKVFHDLGLAIYSGEVMPLPFSEISSFSQATGIRLNYSEVVTLKKMSEQFVIWLNKGKKQSCDAPYYKDNRTTEQMRADVSAKFKALARKNK